jgi:hypothetical protein
VLEGDEEPTDADVEEAAQSARVRALLMAGGAGESAGASARKQADDRPGEYLREMVGNAPGSLYDNATGLVSGAFEGLKTLGRATGEAGQNIGGVAREFVGMEPHYTNGTPEADKIVDFAKGIVPATIKHYGEYLDPDKRALKMRDDPFGVVMDVAGAKAVAGPPIKTAAKVVKQAPAVAMDAAIGVAKMSPMAVVQAVRGHGPISTAKGFFKNVMERGPVDPPPAKAAAPPVPEEAFIAEAPIAPPTPVTSKPVMATAKAEPVAAAPKAEPVAAPAPKAEPKPAVIATDIPGSRSKAARGPDGKLSPTDRKVFAENIRKGLSDEDATANMLTQRAERAKANYEGAKAAKAEREAKATPAVVAPPKVEAEPVKPMASHEPAITFKSTGKPGHYTAANGRFELESSGVYGEGVRLTDRVSGETHTYGTLAKAKEAAAGM